MVATCFHVLGDMLPCALAQRPELVANMEEAAVLRSLRGHSLGAFSNCTDRCMHDKDQDQDLRHAQIRLGREEREASQAKGWRKLGQAIAKCHLD
jgi:hypothetical protein